MPVLQPGVPSRAAAFGGPVEHQPEGIRVGGAARVLSRIGHRIAHLAAVEVANNSIAPGEDPEARNISVFGVDVSAGVVAGHVGNKRQVRKATLRIVVREPLDGRARGDGDGNTLAQVDGGPVPGAQKRCAHRTRRFALRAVHHAVDHQRALVTKKAREADWARLGDEVEVLGNLAAQRQGPPQGGHALHIATQFDLFDQEPIASSTILRAFVGEMGLVGRGELPSGGKGLRTWHRASEESVQLWMHSTPRTTEAIVSRQPQDLPSHRSTFVSQRTRNEGGAPAAGNAGSSLLACGNDKYPGDYKTSPSCVQRSQTGPFYKLSVRPWALVVRIRVRILVST